MCVEYQNYFVDLDNVISGTLDVYVEPAAKDHEIVYGADVVRGTVIADAVYKERNSEGLPQVVVRVNSKSEPFDLTTDTFRVYNQDEKATVIAVKRVNYYCYLILSEPLDPMRGYLVGFGDQTCAVTMPDFYSTTEFESQYIYTGNDLGVTYTPEKTTLRVWAPTAMDMQVNLYKTDDPDTDPDPVSTVPMRADVRGTWVCELLGDLDGTYYTYLVTSDHQITEACDPYACACGVSGQRSMILDLDVTDPFGWEKDTNPRADCRMTDAVIYELSVPELSAHSSSGILGKGWYYGMTEEGTENDHGNATGLDHIVDLGVTHVQLLPVYDLGNDHSVNYNVPEGSYSTDPATGWTQVSEMKRMVRCLHERGIGVIMEMNYGFLEDAEAFCFNQIVPGYFTRPFSGIRNHVASERAMVRKYIVDSVNYWVEEYHIDGFCLDMAGLLDTDTVNEIIRTVHEQHPDVIFYGEGQTRKTKLSQGVETLCTQSNGEKVPGFGFLNETFCNTVRGRSNGTQHSAGYISGGDISGELLDQCFMAMAGTGYSTPTQSVNYLSRHDDYTLYDQITQVNKEASEQERIARHKLGAAFTLTAQGIPVLRAGQEILHSASDGDVLKWDTLSQEAYQGVLQYYKGLIAFRLSHPSLRLEDGASVQEVVKPVSGLPDGVVAYHLQGDVENERAEGIFCAFNATESPVTVTLPQGDWNLFINGEKAGRSVLGEFSGEYQLPPLSAAVLAIEEEEILVPPTCMLWYLGVFFGGALILVGLMKVLRVIWEKRRSSQ